MTNSNPDKLVEKIRLPIQDFKDDNEGVLDSLYITELIMNLIADHFEKIELPEWAVKEPFSSFGQDNKRLYEHTQQETRQFFINELRRKK